MLEEDLLEAWLRLSTTVVNPRIVSALTYGESLVCNVLYQGRSGAGACAEPLGARDGLDGHEGATSGGAPALVGRVPDAPSAMTATELCRLTGILKSQMNRILTSLERKGIVSRRRSEADRRCVLVSMSDSQAALYEEQHRQIIAVVAGIIDEMGPERVRQAVDVLGELSAAAGCSLERAARGLESEGA